MDFDWGDGTLHPQQPQHAFSFCCNQCGILGICSHKKETAASIRFAPQHERTARELASSSKMERELVWADMTANPHATHYNEYIRLEEEHPELVQNCLLQMEKELSKYEPQRNTHTNTKNHNKDCSVKDAGVAGGEGEEARVLGRTKGSFAPFSVGVFGYRTYRHVNFRSLAFPSRSRRFYETKRDDGRKKKNDDRFVFLSHNHRCSGTSRR